MGGVYTERGLGHKDVWWVIRGERGKTPTPWTEKAPLEGKPRVLDEGAVVEIRRVGTGGGNLAYFAAMYYSTTRCTF